LSCFYIDDYGYQENKLVQEHVKAGHEVLVLASTESYSSTGELCYLQPSEYMGSDGAKVIRLPYTWFLPILIAKKLRIYPGVYEEIKKFKPDVIMFHGLASYELITVARYARNHQNVLLYADSHEDFNNSARTFLSRNTVYRFFYTPILKLAKKSIEKFLYITYETKLFCNKVYGLDDAQLEFYPLGGTIFENEDYLEKRSSKRRSLNISNNDIVFLQTGKFDLKKKLVESLMSFQKIQANNVRFIVAGVLSNDIKDQVLSLIDLDIRIIFLGWVSTDELSDLLCMCDVYVQPGSQSATMQMALSARCAVILDDVPSHRHIFCDNGFLVNSLCTLDEAIKSCIQFPLTVYDMQDKSYQFAKQNLDYSILAKRLLIKSYNL
jgi:hypothetical protein